MRGQPFHGAWVIVCWGLSFAVFWIWGSIVVTTYNGVLPFQGIGIPDSSADWILGSQIKALVLAPILFPLVFTFVWLRRRNKTR